MVVEAIPREYGNVRSVDVKYKNLTEKCYVAPCGSSSSVGSVSPVYRFEENSAEAVEAREASQPTPAEVEQQNSICSCKEKLSLLYIILFGFL